MCVYLSPHVFAGPLGGVGLGVCVHVYLSPHVFAGPLGGVGLGVCVQDMVEVVTCIRRLHVSIEDSRCPDVLRVEPAEKGGGSRSHLPFI